MAAGTRSPVRRRACSLPTPDEAAWQTMLEDSRTTSIKGAAVLHGGTFAITNGAAYRGEDFTTMPGSMMHLRNNASMNVRNAIFSSGSRLEISGSAPSRISADNLTAGGTTFGFRLSGPSGTPMLSITANTFTFGNNAFVLSPDQGITHLADGSYTLLHFTGQDNLHTLFSSATLRFEGIEAETSEFSWNEEGTELTWKGSGIIVTEFRPEPPSPGDPDHPATPALSDAATMAAAVSINTLWTTTRSSNASRTACARTPCSSPRGRKAVAKSGSTPSAASSARMANVDCPVTTSPHGVQLSERI